MVGDKQFYSTFIKKFVHNEADVENKNNPDDEESTERVNFLFHQFEIIPKK